VYPGGERGAAQERVLRRVGGDGRAGGRSRRTQVHLAQPPHAGAFSRQAFLRNLTVTVLAGFFAFKKLYK